VKVPGGVEAFTVAAAELAGGVVEQGADGVDTVLWPEPGSGDVAVRQLVFDPELLDEAPDAELVSLGSCVLICGGAGGMCAVLLPPLTEVCVVGGIVCAVSCVSSMCPSDEIPPPVEPVERRPRFGLTPGCMSGRKCP
jgi:hypothetical protein